MKTVTGTLKIIERLKNSYYGNPRYLVTIGDVKAYTKPDSSIAYWLPNFEGKTVKARVKHYYGKLTIIEIEE
jgi:hypothetical protein